MYLAGNNLHTVGALEKPKLLDILVIESVYAWAFRNWQAIEKGGCEDYINVSCILGQTDSVNIHLLFSCSYISEVCVFLMY